MKTKLKYYGWRATGFIAQGFAIFTATLAKGVGFALQSINLAVVKSLVKVTKWFAYTAAECHINAVLVNYIPKTYR